ncbi:hypothetical protein [Gimibacter soli]|uniref:Uncharacterized protein n=1 Tax=Gimibacter soli TaxID=3024400 RepID=A0AAE9XME6_9PROT|nr:hypothetical protein [Gimibacter soli]WCL53603.1 hypothetical protein PH603_13775 [Gimibacter soli]
MIAIFFRFILLSLPLAAVILWLRHRAKVDRTEEELEADIRRLRRMLGACVVGMLVAAIGLYVTDDRRSESHTRYFPPHMEGETLVPGRFEPVEEAEDGEKDNGERDGRP